MKITLPEDISDITLLQTQKYYKLLLKDDLDQYNFDKRKIGIFTNLPVRLIKDIAHKDYADILKQIDKALAIESEFKNMFTLNGIEYGFIPNLDKITTAEYLDLSTFGVDVENLHKTMSVLFRKVTQKDRFGNYQIEYYEGTEEKAEAMKKTPMNIVNGALVFFYNLAKELRINIQKYSDQAIVKDQKLQTTL